MVRAAFDRMFPGKGRGPVFASTDVCADSPWTPACAGELSRDRENGFTSARRSAEHGFTSSPRSAEHGFTSSPRSAEHGFTSSPRSAEHGFTLVEMMVVITIIGLAAAAVVLTLPAANGGTRAEATRFAARVANLRDRAVIDGRGYGVWVTASGYGFERRHGNLWEQVADGRLSRADWRSGTAATVNGQPQGRVTFDRVGLPDRPATLALQAGEDGATVTIDAAGEVSVR